MLETILYAIGFFIFTIFLQWLLHKVRKNHNQGNSAIWVGNGAIIVICVMGLMTKNINYFSALLGFVVGDEVGKLSRQDDSRDTLRKNKFATGKGGAL